MTGAGRGLGRAYALSLAERGALVVVQACSVSGVVAGAADGGRSALGPAE